MENANIDHSVKHRKNLVALVIGVLSGLITWGLTQFSTTQSFLNQIEAQERECWQEKENQRSQCEEDQESKINEILLLKDRLIQERMLFNKALTEAVERHESEVSEIKRLHLQELVHVGKVVQQMGYSSSNAVSELEHLKSRLTRQDELEESDMGEFRAYFAGARAIISEYEKPLESFSELGAILDDEEAKLILPENPESRFNFFQRIFGSEYIEAVKAQGIVIGKIESLKEFKKVVRALYARTQTDMKNTAEKLNKLSNNLIDIDLKRSENRTMMIEDISHIQSVIKKNAAILGMMRRTSTPLLEDESKEGQLIQIHPSK